MQPATQATTPPATQTQQPAIRIDRPVADALLVIGSTVTVSGLVTGKGGPEPTSLNSLTIQIGAQAPVEATLTQVVSHPPQPQPSWTFRADMPVPGPAGPTAVVARAAFDSGQTITSSRPIAARDPTSTPALQQVTITFNTHADNKNADTVLHVFVKNRSNTSATPEQASEFVTNLVAFQHYETIGTTDVNPYLGFGQSLAQGVSVEPNSSHSFNIPLRSTPVPIAEVVLPVVNIHIMPNGNDRWIFDYTITFLFDDGRSFSASSTTDGVTGIILDQDNPNYSGICVENPFNPLPPHSTPDTDAVLTEVALTFSTHNDNKNSDTQLNVHIVNRLNASSYQDIVVGTNLLAGQEFADPSLHMLVFSPTALPLASNAIRLQDMVVPLVFVNIAPSGNDRWIFDYQVRFTFSDGVTSQTFSSRTNGVILDQDNHKHAGVYQGRTFPTVTPPARPLPNFSDQRLKSKVVSLGYLQTRLDELLNKRTEPPIFKLRLHNSGSFGSQPESYYDLQSITADAPPAGPLPPGFTQGVTYTSNPTSLGRLDHGIYFDDVNSTQIAASVDTTQPTPLTVTVTFETGGPSGGIFGLGTLFTANVTGFSVRFSFTLALDQTNRVIDLMSWVEELQALKFTPSSGSSTVIVSGHFLGKPVSVVLPVVAGAADAFVSSLLDQVVHVELVTNHTTDVGGVFQEHARQTIFKKLTQRDPFDGRTIRDRLKQTVTDWLLGGSVDGESGCTIQSVAVQGDQLEIGYTGPTNTFAPPVPPAWPAGTDFSPGTLANIEHLVVLTMENHSFDSMLGYLSLPRAQGGMGRTEVDGLKGGEFNLLDGKVCSSFAFPPRDTVFAPDPPHGYEPVHHAINCGNMDGFVQSYREERGPTLAPRIMGYYTADNVPVSDALARDFAIGHRWFASHPGPTFCNRFYELTGRLNLDADGHWEFDHF